MDKTKKRLKIAFIVFLVLGILTLINRVTYLVIYLGIGLTSAMPIDTIAKILVINNYITNIWYIWLIIAGFLYWLYKKQSKNIKGLKIKEVKMDKEEKKKEVFTGWSWFILIACGFFTLMFLVGSLSDYHGLFLFIAFLISFIVMINKLRVSKRSKQ